MSFGAPKVLYLLFLLPFFFILFSSIFRYIEKVRSQFHYRGAKRLNRFSGRFHYVRLALCFLLGFASLIVALADPQVERVVKEPVYKKIDVVLLLDNSFSMRAKDIAPSRMERAREEVKNFIIHRSENIGRFGLVSFAGSSVILSYLTTDPSNILFYLDYLETDTRPSFGTNIGAGVKSGLQVVQKEMEIDPTLRPQDLIFILISDGEDHGKELRDVVLQAVQTRIKIYSIGFGTRMGAYIPIGEDKGRTVFLLDEEGRKILATFDEATLRWTAEVTRGQFYRSHTGRELYENLNKILWSERRVTSVNTVTKNTSLHYWFLVTGFAALALFYVQY